MHRISDLHVAPLNRKTEKQTGGKVEFGNKNRKIESKVNTNRGYVIKRWTGTKKD